MKIAIIGTRGIPNHYGGFEQFAEYLSVYLAKNGHNVTVYNSHEHPYQENVYEGVDIVHCFDPEDKIGTVGQFVYDLNCIQDVRHKDFQIILQLGYTSSSIWGFLLPKDAVVITNMDGLEWKRSKFSKPVQVFLKLAEKLAVQSSDYLISDSIGIQDYINEKYSVNSEYIPYGANLFTNPNNEVLNEYSLKPYDYDMLVARLEPENSIEIILDGVVAANVKRDFLVIGKHETTYGSYLKKKFGDFKNIKFIGGVYDINILNNLRYFSNIYFHGHTVGGTNPSLLEAMASGAMVCANDNIFNKAILENDAFYFSSYEDVSAVLESKIKLQHSEIIEANSCKIRELYSWPKINESYLDFMLNCYEKKNNKRTGVMV